MKRYRNVDLLAIGMQDLIDQACDIVQTHMLRDNVQDQGTCVLDAGIKIEYLPPRCKNPVFKTIVRAPFQGNISNQQVLKPALAFLQSHGIACFYDDGRMD